ncbi:MAG: CrcB family protein [Desulfovibrionaceae bacterium]|nr:CrcB family protein [Desulfovibrionaceae bacterium]
MNTMLAIAAGGACGALLRFAIAVQCVSSLHNPLAGTILVNAFGSFLMGVLLAFSESHGESPVHLWISRGFLGALTTFSTFSFETFSLLQKNKTGSAAAYWILTLLCSPMLAASGYFGVKLCFI